MKSVKDVVYGFKTKNEEGFTDSEIKDVLKLFPDVNISKFNDSMLGHTCMIINNETIMYHEDVYFGILAGLKK